MPKLCKDIDELFEKGGIGDWAFMDSPKRADQYIAIRLPDTAAASDDNFCILAVRIPDQPGGSFWNWDGNREAPTLTPSILHHSDPPWHGYMRAGVLVEA